MILRDTMLRSLRHNAAVSELKHGQTLQFALFHHTLPFILHINVLNSFASSELRVPDSQMLRRASRFWSQRFENNVYAF